MNPNDQGDDEAELSRLLQQDQEGDTAVDDVTLCEVRQELESLASELRHLPPPDPLEAEAGCFLAVELASRVVTEPARLSHWENDTDALLEAGTLGPYELQELIGRGGMGAVYKALHRRLNKVVALKVVSPHRTGDPEIATRFDREMKAVGRLDHPHLVRALDAGEADGKHYLAMEYIAGCDLARLVRTQGPLPVAEACELIVQAAQGLEAAHARGVIHRDIKPANLILAQQEFGLPIVKVLDLGLALLSQNHVPDQQDLTSATQLMGSVDFMAPEQASDSHTVDARADIYSLGATLYALLTGGSIFAHQPRRTLLQKLTALATEAAPSIRQQRPEISPQLAEIVGQMLARNPAARPASMSQVIAALRPFATGANLESLLQSATVAPEADSVIGTSSYTVNEPVLSVAREVQPIPARSRQTWWWVSGVAAACLVWLAVVLTIQTPEGEIVVELPDDLPPAIAEQIQITVRNKGVVQVANQTAGWVIEAEEGKYDVELNSPTDTLELSNKQILVSRDKQTLVRVTFKPNAPSVVATTPAKVPPARAAAPSGYTWPVDQPAPAIAPFTADQARQFQADWAKHLDLPVEIENSVGMKLRLIPPGEYLMGTSSAELKTLLVEINQLHAQKLLDDDPWERAIRSESPAVRVVLPRPFYMGVHEVTQRQFYAATGKAPFIHSAADPTIGPSLQGIDTSAYPAEGITWYDMVGFCEQLSQLEQLAPFQKRTSEFTAEPVRGDGYRLPMEAEWEYACRAGTTTRYYTGDTPQDLERAAWYRDNWQGKMHAVGQREANAFGLFDMLGNVSEATLDHQAVRSDLPTGQTPDPYLVPHPPTVSPEGTFVKRGGDVIGLPLQARAALRLDWTAKYGRIDRDGLRVVLPVESVRKVLSAKQSPPANADFAHRRAALWLKSLKVKFYALMGSQEQVIQAGDPLPTEAFRIRYVNFFSPDVDALGDQFFSAFDENFRGVAGPRVEFHTNALTPESLARFVRHPTLVATDQFGVGLVATTDDMLAEITQLPRLRYLNLGNSSQLTAAGIRQLQNCPELSDLSLLGSRLTPEALSHLRQVPALKYLNLDGLPLTAEHVDQLAQTNLTSLILPNCGLDDSLVTRLVPLTGLTHLTLFNCPITDESLPTLTQFKHLTNLELKRTRVTAEGRQKIRQALPNCTVSPE